MTAGRGPAPSGARYLGDDYQHLLTWLHAAKLVHRDPEIVRVELEKHGAGNLDDLVVHRATGAGEYHQVKFVRNPGREPLAAGWFTDKGSSKKSPLQRFHQSWKDLTVDGKPPFMVLHTNRLIASGDAVMACIDGVTDRLLPKFAQASGGSATGKMRTEWAEHLGVDEAELLQVLADLRIRAARVSVNELREHCRWVMDASGLASTATAVDQGMLVARGWVEEGIRDVNAAIVAEVVDERGLRAGEPRATVVIQAIDHDIYPELATEVVDWVDAFPGDDPRERRAPASAEVWTQRFAADLAAAEQSVRAQGYREVRLGGAFRLATSIYAGTVFPDTRGYQVLVAGRSGDGTWTGDIASYGDRVPIGVSCRRSDVGEGDALAIGLSITGSLETAVRRHIEASQLPVAQLAHITVPQTGTDALTGGSDVRGWVAEVRDILRELAEEGWAQFHLFMFGPQTAAVLLGHGWNRMPPTQLWDDLGPGRGYTPAFLVRG
jgi:hypothetical protein